MSAPPWHRGHAQLGNAARTAVEVAAARTRRCSDGHLFEMLQRYKLPLVPLDRSQLHLTCVRCLSEREISDSRRSVWRGGKKSAQNEHRVGNHSTCCVRTCCVLVPITVIFLGGMLSSSPALGKTLGGCPPSWPAIWETRNRCFDGPSQTITRACRSKRHPMEGIVAPGIPCRHHPPTHPPARDASSMLHPPRSRERPSSNRRAEKRSVAPKRSAFRSDRVGNPKSEMLS